MRKNNKVFCNSHLPPELIREVLARLPVKTLIKFRCVCKSWCSLIDSRDFTTMHLKLYNDAVYSENTYCFVLKYCKGGAFVFTTHHGDTLKRFGSEVRKDLSSIRCTWGSFNGLMLIEYFSKFRNTTWELWNPCIRKTLHVPDCPIRVDVYPLLGFAPSSCDYKLLAVDCQLGIVVIYSLNDHCWRVKTNQINVQDSGASLLKKGSGSLFVYVGGTTYWVRTTRNQSEAARVMFSFDFDAEEFRCVQLPEAVKDSRVWFIFRLNKSIAIFTMSFESSCIWVRETDNEGNPWRLWFLGEPNSNACELLKSISSEILYAPKTNSFVMLRYHYPKDKFMSYNLTSHKMQHLAKSLHNAILFNTYVETLILHKGIEGQSLVSLP